MQYRKPTVTELGSVRQVTLVDNKVGPNADVYSASVPIVGSIVPAP